MPGTPVPWVSPYVWVSPDVDGNVIQLTVNFNNATLAIGNGSVFRDPACRYVHVYVGLGPDGTPDTTAQVFAVPAGSTNLNKNQFSAQGFSTLTDVLATQITAGP